MSDRLILNKLQKPALPKTFIEKEGIVSGLSASKVSLVCASAGTGKSTAVSSWIEGKHSKYLWYTLDDWDNDFLRFLSYVQKGIEDIDDTVPQKLASFTQGSLPMEAEGLMKGIVALLHEVPVPWVWVLDDYHTITEGKIHALINALLKHLPSNLTLCIISREDPPIRFGRLRAQGGFNEIRVSSLNFSREDAERFYKSATRVPLTQPQIDFLYKRSEGWVAGVQLIAMTLEKVEAVDTFIQSFKENQAYIMDYLLEEVLERHSDGHLAFLLKTSVLSYFNEALCAYALEIPRETAASEIEYLLRTNSFLATLNQESGWYRYHQLFRVLLSQELKRYKSLGIDGVYLRAGKWYEVREGYQEAISYYIDGGHFGDAQRVIEHRFAVMDMALHSATWLGLAKRLPVRYIESSPVLCIGYGWALLDQGQIEGCQKWFNRSKALYDAWHLGEQVDIHDRKTFDDIPILLLSSEAYVAAINGAYHDLKTHTEKLKALTATAAYSRQWVVESFLGMMHWGQGNLTEALETMSALREQLPQEVSPSIKNAFTWLVAEICLCKGALTKAKVLLENAIETVEENAVLPFLVGTYYLLLASIESLRGHRDQAYKLLETSKMYGHRYEFMDWRYKYQQLKARLFMQDGLYEQARLCVLEGKGYTYLNPAPEGVTLEVLAFWLLFLTDSDEAKKRYLIEEALETFEAADEAFPNYSEEMRWKVLLSQAPIDRFGERLRPICESLLRQAKHQRRQIEVIEYTLILRRYVTDAVEKAHLLDLANAYAKKEGIRQPFIEFAPETVIGGDMPFEAQRAQINETLPEPLTTRELELIALIAKGYSNQEISNHLFIALSTVKSYNNKLFSKLEVKRRTEAVAKAQSIGLIE